MKKTTKLISILLVVAMLLSMAPLSLTAFAASPTPYDGVPVTPQQISSSNYAKLGLTDDNWSQFDGYYAIRNAKELYGFANIINGGSNKSNGVVLQDIVINETVSASGATYSWSPIGTQDVPFLGSFNGNGCTISGLYINGSDSQIGLFGSVGEYYRFENIEIQNIVLVNSYIRGDLFVGGIAGCLWGNNVHISNCRIESDVTVAATEYELGGIVGGFTYAYILTNHVHSIKNCVVYGKVVSERIWALTGIGEQISIMNVGAITGTYQSGNDSKANVAVDNCYYISGCMVTQFTTDGSTVYPISKNFGKGGAGDYNSNGGCTVLESASASHTCVSVEHMEVKATCEYPGLSNYEYCLVCGKVTSGTKTETPATGHNWQAATCTQPETCSNCGITQGEALGHTNLKYAIVFNDTEKLKLACDVCGTVGTAKISASSVDYDGAPHGATVTYTGDFPEVTVYYKKPFDENVSTEAPTEAGTYFAYFTQGGYKMQKRFGINKIDIDDITAPSPNALTYTASAQELVIAGSSSKGTMLYGLTNKIAEMTESIPTAVDAGEYTVYYYLKSDNSNYNNSSVASVKVKISPRPVTVTAANASKTYGEVDPEYFSFSYNLLYSEHKLNGQPARTPGENVGVYEIGQGTITQEDNPNYDITFVSGKFTIEPDASGIEGLTIENVKSTDKENVEYVYNQLENAVKDLADEDKIAEWNTLQAYCGTMRQRIYIVENQIKAFENKLGEYDIDTVTSDDNDDLVNLFDSVYSFTVEYNDNLTDDEKDKCAEISAAIAELTRRIGTISEEITRITNAVNGYDEATIKYSDYTDILQLIDDIEALTDGQNITDGERASLEELNTKANLLAAKIRSTADEIARITRAVNAYNIDTVKSSDKAAIENLIARIKKLTDGDNITDAEREQLVANDETLDALLAKINATADEIERIEESVNGYDEAAVKSSDKADIEQLLADINAITAGDNITDSERADLLTLADTVNELLAVISDTADEISRIVNAVNAYDVNTITGDDVQDLLGLIDDVNALLETDNLTPEETEALYQAIKDVQRMISIYDTVSAQLGSIKDRLNGYDEATVKSSDKADIEQLKADIKELTDGQNLTADEREYLVNADAECDKLIAKIADTKSEYDRVIAAANGYDEATVTSEDKDALVQLNDDIYALALTDNVTADEIENLENAHDKVLGLIDKLTGISEEIKRIVAELEKYVFGSVKSDDKADIEQLIEDIKALTDTQNITADERTILEGADKTCDKLIAKIDETVAEINRINDATNAYDEATVTSADKEAIEKLIADIKALTDGDNITDAEREQLNSNDATLDALLAKINATADEIERIETAVNGYDEETVKSTDKADIEKLIEDVKALTDATNITEDERTKLGKLDATLDSLIKKIDDTAAETARIDEAVNAYDEETVKSSDIPALGKLIDDIKALTDGDNLTDDEKAALEETDKAIDELVEKLTEVAEEIKRVDEAVKSYDEETVKSSDSDELAQLKEDVQALIDSTNTTENEKTALGEIIKDIEALEDKIAETEEKLEEIKGIENGYIPEDVTSDDKAAIEDAIAEIEAVNPDNLTDEQKAEYEELKAEFEALLKEIEKAGSEVEAIGAELEMFDENRVTIFWEDDIEALKAKIDELLADENMGEAEKAKLNEYKAQAEKLIEIINDPCEYFSMRLFYFVWDALNWLVNHVVFIFNWIVAMF